MRPSCTLLPVFNNYKMMFRYFTLNTLLNTIKQHTTYKTIKHFCTKIFNGQAGQSHKTLLKHISFHHLNLWAHRFGKLLYDASVAPAMLYFDSLRPVLLLALLISYWSSFDIHVQCMQFDCLKIGWFSNVHGSASHINKCHLKFRQKGEQLQTQSMQLLVQQYVNYVVTTVILLLEKPHIWCVSVC